ncbi:hypothetical protein [Cupriavidus pinatubonensis]|uniref:Uncharacterized protein n=1 Tax=Cupriavidus pinatubonensis TaxID=248026 RepID=A0ABM8W9E5_9BURK|nr:hypothetical protein [Cupriavidus pinatubonensis]CAG9163840.1 hypothetical protein LMG23994_00300 [Cupriavidus pinatubonensis]
MAAQDFSNTLIEAQGNHAALFALASARLADISRKADQLVSLGLAGAKHAEPEDAVSAGVFRTIADVAGDARAFHELQLVLGAMCGATSAKAQ